MTENASVLIETVGLKKNFGSLEVLKGIDEKIYRGQVVSVIGPSGGGKSTFLRCLNLLETPSAGKVFLDGVEMDFTDSSRPKKTLISMFKLKVPICIILVVAVLASSAYFMFESNNVATTEMSLNYE